MIPRAQAHYFRPTPTGLLFVCVGIGASLVTWGIHSAQQPLAMPTAVAEDALPSRTDGTAPTCADANWWRVASAQIAAEEYNVTPSADGLQSPNRAQNLRAHFREEGIEVVPRAGDTVGAWRFRWVTSGFGRTGAVEPVNTANPEPNGASVIYRRRDFDEWYENSPKGIEQGFTLHSAPPGDGPLRVVGRIAGSLRAELTEDGAVELMDDNGARVLRYAELHVWDAEGDDVDARLALDGNDLAIVVDDRGAAYPLTIDPLMTSPDWTAESDQDDALFGGSVVTAGDVNGDGFSDVVVGSHMFDGGQPDEGRVFVFYGSPAGVSATAAWSADGNQATAFFGYSVATAGDVNGDGFADVIVGAYGYSNAQTDEGRAFVFHGSAIGLGITAAWTAEIDQAGAQLGYSVAPAGDVNGDGYSDVVVGANRYDNGQSDEGRALAYYGSASGLVTSIGWSIESNQANALLGWSVALAGDVNGDGYSDVIVGAPVFSNVQLGEGRAIVCHGSASGLGVSASWMAESDQAAAAFGSSVSTAGDVDGDGYADVIVGALAYDNGQPDEGGTWVYRGSESGLQTTASWAAEGDQANALFGTSVGTAGDVNGDGYADVIVGANGYDNVETDEGRAFVFLGGATGPAAAAGWTAESDQAGAFFGASAATAGDINGDGYSDVIVGALRFDNGESDEGRAFAYHGSAAGLAATAAWMAESDQGGSSFGASVSTAGDVNGDGFSDVIVGAEAFDNGESNEGRAYVFHGSAAGLGSTADWIAESDQASAHFGASVATAGDVNGDGYSDIIVGADDYDNGETDEGRAFVYLGSSAGLAAEAAWTAESDQADAAFGASVSTAGDVNGDGYADVIVGAINHDNGESDEGRVFVYLGSPSGLAPAAAWTAESDQASSLFGVSVSTAGDVNGDGFSDVIVGASQFDNGQGNEGRTFVYHGSTGGLSASADWTAESDQGSATFGSSVSTAGDVNGDGYSDVIIGATSFDNGQSNEGRVFVFHGSVDGLEAGAAWTAESDQASATLGRSASAAGDVNGDGYSDVIVTAELYDAGESNEGRAWVYHGSASGLAATAAWIEEIDQASARFGGSAASAGDVNGDGFADVVVGAYTFSNAQTFEGGAFVYYGNGGPGRVTLPRQQRTDGSTPIAHLGSSDSETEFRVRALLPSIFGRTNLEGEIEVKELGVQFDGQSTVAASLDDTGSDGIVEIDQLVTGLAPGTHYHWRARARYDLVRTPLQPHGPWLHVPTHGWNEADLRTAGALPVDVAGGASSPRGGFDLALAGPNPFRERCDVRLSLAYSARVDVDVFDVSGRRVAQLVRDEAYVAGEHIVSWDGRDRLGARVAAGTFWLRARTGAETRVSKVVLVR